MLISAWSSRYCRIRVIANVGGFVGKWLILSDIVWYDPVLIWWICPHAANTYGSCRILSDITLYWIGGLSHLLLIPSDRVWYRRISSHLTAAADIAHPVSANIRRTVSARYPPISAMTIFDIGGYWRIPFFYCQIPPHFHASVMPSQFSWVKSMSGLVPRCQLNWIIGLAPYWFS